MTILHFLKPGHNNQECFGPDHAEITIPLIDGGFLDEEQIAELQSITLPPGNQYFFLACRSGSGFPTLVTFNLDWER